MPDKNRVTSSCDKLQIFLIAFCFTLSSFSKPPVSKANGDGEEVQKNTANSSTIDNSGLGERRKAEPGVGIRGQKLKDRDGLLATPAKTLFRTKERLIFMTIDQVLRMHEIQFGFPKSHEEFMEKIIQQNNIELPGLPDGRYYEYDTKTNELMVVETTEQ